MYCLYATTDKELVESFRNGMSATGVLTPIGENCSAVSYNEMLSFLDSESFKDSVYAYSCKPFYMIELSNNLDTYEKLESFTGNSVRSVSLIEHGSRFKFFNSKKVTNLFSVDGAIFARDFEWVSEPVSCDLENLSIKDKKLYDFEGIVVAVMILSHHILNPDDVKVFNYSIIHSLAQLIVEEHEVDCDVNDIASNVTELLGFDNTTGITLRDFMNARNSDLKDAILLLESENVDCRYFKCINRLYFKVKEEIQQFKSSVLIMPPSDIYDSAYKIVIYCDFYQWFSMLHDDMLCKDIYVTKKYIPETAIDCDCLDKLYFTDYLLEYLYDKWLSMDYTVFEDITHFMEIICLDIIK